MSNGRKEQEAKTETAVVPDEFLCPLSCDIMSNPVILDGTGMTYEREWINQCLATEINRNRNLVMFRDPKNRIEVPIKRDRRGNASLPLTQNYAIKNAIERWHKEQEDAKKAKAKKTISEAEKQQQEMNLLLAHDLLAQAKQVMEAAPKEAIGHLYQMPTILPEESKYLIQLEVKCCLTEIYLSTMEINKAEVEIHEAMAVRKLCAPFSIDAEAPFKPEDPYTKDQYLRIAKFELLRGEISLYKYYSGVNSIPCLTIAANIFKHYDCTKELTKAQALLGFAQLKQGNKDQAKKCFEEKGIDPEYPLLMAGWGQVADGSYEQAQKTVLKLDQQKISSSADFLAKIIAKNSLAVLSESQKKYTEALSIVGQLIQLYETELGKMISENFSVNQFTLNVRAYLSRGIILFQQQNLFHSALSDFNTIFEKLGLYRGSADNEKLANYPAVVHTAFACRLRMRSEMPELFVGESASATAERLDQVVEQANIFLEQNMPTASKTALVDARRARAAAYFYQEKYKESLEDYNLLIPEKRDNSLGYYIYRAKVHLELGDLESASKDCKNTLKSKYGLAHRYKVLARETLCTIAHRLLANPGQNSVQTSQKVVTLFTANDYINWPSEEGNYKDAYAYLTVAYLQQNQTALGLAAYKELNAILSVDKKPSPATTAAHQFVLVYFAHLAKSDFYDTAVKVGAAVSEHQPQEKQRVAEFLLSAACKHCHVDDAFSNFKQLHLITGNSRNPEAIKQLLMMAENIFQKLKSSQYQRDAENVIKITQFVLERDAVNVKAQELFAQACKKLYRDKPEDKALANLNFAKRAMESYDDLVGFVQDCKEAVDEKTYVEYRGQRAIVGFDTGLKEDEVIKADLEFVLSKKKDCASTIPAYLSVILGRQRKPDFKQSLVYAQMALDKTKSGTGEQMMIGYFYGEALLKLGENEEALKYFMAIHHVAEKKGQDYFRGLLPGEYLSRIGAIYVQQKKFDEAEKFLNRALPKAPEEPRFKALALFVYIQLGTLEQMRGKTEQAQQYLQKAEALDPEDPTVLKMLRKLAEAKATVSSSSIFKQDQPSKKDAGPAVAQKITRNANS